MLGRVFKNLVRYWPHHGFEYLLVVAARRVVPSLCPVAGPQRRPSATETQGAFLLSHKRRQTAAILVIGKDAPV